MKPALLNSSKILFTRLRCRCGWNHFRIASSGTVSVELAIVAVFLTFLAIGAFDFARYGIEQTRLTNAARAGSQFALQGEVSAADKSAIEQAVRDDAGDTNSEIQVEVGSVYCSCPVDGVVSCSANCSDGGYAPMYVDVTVKNSVDLLFSYPGIDASLPVAATSQLRVR